MTVVSDRDRGEHTEAELERLLAGAHGVAIGTKDKRLLAAVLDPAATPGLAWVHTLSAGADQLPLEGLAARGGVVVTHHTDISSRPLAEFTAAAVLHFAKDLPALGANHAGRVWERPPRGLPPRQLAGLTVGVVGCGSIGRAIAKTMKRGFGTRVVGLTRTARRAGLAALEDVDELLSVEADGPAGLDWLLAESDVVALAMPGTTDTTNVIGAAELAALRPDAILVSVGRGTAIDEVALAAVLAAPPRPGELRGVCAALDVFAAEPLALDHPFWDVPPGRLVLSPHTMDQQPCHWPATAEAWACNCFAFAAAAGDPDAALAAGMGPAVDLDEGY